MNIKTRPALMVTMSLIASSAMVWADDSNTSNTMNNATNAVEHPVETIHQHEVNADSVNAQEFAQQKAEAKARMNQAKADYEKSLQSNGADSDVTKQAKKRLADDRKEYRKYAMKASTAKQDLGEDAQKAAQDKATQ